MEMKYTILDTESITVMIISNPMDFRSFTMKSILIFSHYTFRIERGYSLPMSRC